MKLACWFCETEHQIDEAQVPRLDGTITCMSCRRDIVLPPSIDDLPGSLAASDLPMSTAELQTKRFESPTGSEHDDLPELDRQSEIPLIDDLDLIALESPVAQISESNESERATRSSSSDRSDLPGSVHHHPTHEIAPLSDENLSSGIGKQHELDDLGEFNDRPESSIVTAEYDFDSPFHRPTINTEVIDARDEAPSDGQPGDPLRSPSPELSSTVTPRLGERLTEADPSNQVESTVGVVDDDACLKIKRPGNRRVAGLGGAIALVLVGSVFIAIARPLKIMPWNPNGSEMDVPDSQENRPDLKSDTGTTDQNLSDERIEATLEEAKSRPKQRNNIDERVAPPAALTSRNVHSLPYPELRRATSSYAEAAGHDRALLSFARFRLAHTFGDPAARAALRSSRPRRVDWGLIDSELELAGELGRLIVQNKDVQARRLGEQALNRTFENSAVVEYIIGTSYRGTPVAVALRHFERAVALEPRLLDANMARAALLMSQARRAGEAVATLEEIVRVSQHPSTAVRAASILMENRRFDAIDRVGGPLRTADQANSLAPTQLDTFYRLLVAKHTRSAEFSRGAAAASAWTQIEPNPEAFIAEARLVAAQGEDPEPIIRSAVENVADARGRSELLYELGRLILLGSKAGAPPTSQRAQQVLVEMRSLPGEQAKTWANLLEGDIAVSAERRQQARSAYNESRRDRPNFVESRLATLLIDEDKSGRAITKLSQLERRRDHPEVTRALADFKFTRGNFVGDVVEAAKLYDKALWQTPPPRDPKRVLLSWIKARAESGDREGAYARLDEIHRARPADVEFLSSLIDLAGSLERFDDQLRWQKERLELSPDDPTQRLRYAKTLNQVDRFSEARAIIEELHQSPENRTAESLAELGRSLVESDEVTARALLNEATRLESSAEVYSLLGEVEARQQRYDEAIEHYEKAFELSDKDPSIGRKLGMLQLDRGRTRDAIENLYLVFKLNPQDRQTALSLGKSLNDVGRHRDALQVYQQAGKDTLPEPEFLMRSAVIQLQHFGRTRPAIRLLRQVVELQPDNAEARYYLGYALKDLGRSQEAREQLRGFLQATHDQELASEVSRDLEDLTP